MAVPLFDLTPQHRQLLPRFSRRFEQLVSSSQFILGPFVEQFEEELAQYLGVPHVIGMSSGTDALLAALMALEIGPGDEVITSSFTFFATAGCIARLGAKPVFVDIQAEDFNLDPQALGAAVTPRTRAIMPVHLFGQPAAMEAINTLAHRNGLKVIEDAAQAIGARVGRQNAGTLSDAGCFSFYPTKNLAALGDAGACATHDRDLAERLRSLRGHGQTDSYHHAYIGGNFRLDALQALLLSEKLPLLEQWCESRRAHAAHYQQALAGLPLALPRESLGTRHVFNQFTIRVLEGRRSALMEHLRQRGIGHRIYYPLPLHLQPCFAYLGVPAGSLPESEHAAEQVLSLPIFPELSPSQQDEVVSAIREFYR